MSHRRRHNDVAASAADYKDIDEDCDDLEQSADSVAVQQELAADVTLVWAHNLYTNTQTYDYVQRTSPMYTKSVFLN